MKPAQSGFLLFCVAIVAVFPGGTLSYAEDHPMNRIIVRNGRFMDQATGKRFIPMGFNFNRLRPHPEDPAVLWHDNFNPKRYDKAEVEVMLADLERHGFNIVRVFIDHMDERHGGILSGDGQLSTAYVGNLTDFLKQARRHSIYVILTPTYTPPGGIYARIQQSTQEGYDKAQESMIAGINGDLLHLSRVKAHAQFCADLLNAIKQRDEALLTTVFSVDLVNELHLLADAPPFSLRGGRFTFMGKSYDMSSDAERQSLADAAAVNWFETHAAAARKVCPEVLLTVSVFTYKAVGRLGPGEFGVSKSQDKRMPVRPLALAKRTTIDYLDIHMYMQNPQDGSIKRFFEEDLQSIEGPDLKRVCEERGIPMIVGEYGAFKHAMGDTSHAAKYITEQLHLSFDQGMQGALFWTYDTHEQATEIMHSKFGDGKIFESLAKFASTGPARKP